MTSLALIDLVLRVGSLLLVIFNYWFWKKQPSALQQETPQRATKGEVIPQPAPPIRAPSPTTPAALSRTWMKEVSRSAGNAFAMLQPDLESSSEEEILATLSAVSEYVVTHHFPGGS